MDTDDVLRLGKGSIGPDLSPIKESPLREALQQEAAPLRGQYYLERGVFFVNYAVRKLFDSVR